MLFEILSSLVAGGIAATTYFKQHGTGDDKTKIERIAANAGLVSKDGKKIRIYRRTKGEGFTEYVFQIPLGLSFADFEKKKHVFEDGLNIKRSTLDISLADLKTIHLRSNILEQTKTILMKKKKFRKEIEMSFDGMLKIRIYERPMPEWLPFSDSMLSQCKGWEIPIGVSRCDFVTHDFDAIPHMVVAGATRKGKSAFLKLLVSSLIARRPDDVKITILDLKGGLSFAKFKDVRQVEAVAKSPAEALEALRTIRDEMNRRLEHFLGAGIEDVKSAGVKERHFIIVDEAAQIASAGETDKEIKRLKVECEHILSEIARVAGALGYRLIFCTQYATADTLPRQIKQNADAKLCFRLQTEVASQVVLGEGETDAAHLPLIPGRAVYVTDRKNIVQCAYVADDDINRLIEPHINIRPRKEKKDIEKGNREGATSRSYSLVISET
ncbi:S-DNA-T family DNA segregation ATPase FtsK/SpoIIIE [Anoxybacillus voinovskiensis]|uniref:S-DNA-T family DNA segregation ATPase FtsK/SpoIIIE n=1 Tax=Anoxybacteroides voinovskiense TaxID=230470 RepID=A0A840DXB8_9BACL|nr:FtsK/SpoIIIE domain-containing protein [Anoxybacillus voinovskiensis]MBB4074648.1 S-DNA-T family DNA segregation ATPase FtsK/SpoIIIE [Anoxybacillus voinovskiensis]GGJ73234.1 cell division protein FtsK [Anoxybacillus voinovskiensis]